MKDIGDHPERAKNLHFSFVVLLRAVRKVEQGGDEWRLERRFQVWNIWALKKYTKIIKNRLNSRVCLKMCEVLLPIYAYFILLHAHLISPVPTDISRSFANDVRVTKIRCFLMLSISLPIRGSMGTCFESIRFRFLTMLTQRKSFPILSSLKIKPFPALKKVDGFLVESALCSPFVLQWNWGCLKISSQIYLKLICSICVESHSD